MLLPDPLPDGWHHPGDRLPRRNDTVRVVTQHHHDVYARFVVEHTNDWPSGASWSMGSHGESVPFEDIVAWSPDPTKPFPAQRQTPAPEPVAPEPVAPGPSPAILREVLAELSQASHLLRHLPPDQLDWSPHEGVATVRKLARRLVRLVARMEWILDLDAVDMHLEPALPHLSGVPEIVRTFDANASVIRELALGLTAAELVVPWRLERHGDLLAVLPRGDALRQFGISPLVYHRGALALLLSALGISVPRPDPMWTFENDGV